MILRNSFGISDKNRDGVLAISTPIEAYKQLYLETDSPYYQPGDADISLFDVYNSFTQVITDDKKDVMQKFYKTILIGNILGINKL